MKVQYLEEGQYYIISNHAVALNPIFMSPEIQDHFLSRMEFYLSPICEIAAFRCAHNSFSIVLRTKQRDDFEDLFRIKYGMPYELNPIPESTYIFSQQMSNLQVSLVKKVNRLFDRKGALMVGRFKRELLETPEEVVAAIKVVEEGSGIRKHLGVWENKMALDVEDVKGGWGVERCRLFAEMGFGCVADQIKIDLEGHFEKPIKTSLYSMEIFHQRRLLRCIHRQLE